MPIRFSVSILAVSMLCCGCGGTPKTPAQPAEFDPQKIPDLAIKGVKPDGTTAWSAVAVPPRPEFTPGLIEQGREVFSRACAGCHGDKGAGDGSVTAKYDLGMQPADLTNPLKSIKIRSTAYGTPPLPEDLFRTITRGLPDTPMWSFRDLPAESRWALVGFIMALSPKYSEASAAMPIPKPIPQTAELDALGMEMWTKTCLNCHGIDGLGNPAMAGQNWLGLKFARAGGSRMLGGSSEQDIARTLLTGSHTLSPMMSFKGYFYGDEPTDAEMKEGDRKLWATVYYTRRLLKAQTDAK